MASTRVGGGGGGWGQKGDGGGAEETAGGEGEAAAVECAVDGDGGDGRGVRCVWVGWGKEREGGEAVSGTVGSTRRRESGGRGRGEGSRWVGRNDADGPSTPSHAFMIDILFDRGG